MVGFVSQGIGKENSFMSGNEQRDDTGAVKEGSEKYMPEDFVPTDFDVLVGWARQNFHHAGNVMLRDLIHENVSRYEKADSKVSRGEIITEIVQTVQSRSPSQTGFLRIDHKSGRWIYIGNNKAKDKVGHALRKALQNIQGGGGGGDTSTNTTTMNGNDPSEDVSNWDHHNSHSRQEMTMTSKEESSIVIDIDSKISPVIPTTKRKAEATQPVSILRKKRDRQYDNYESGRMMLPNLEATRTARTTTATMADSSSTSSSLFLERRTSQEEHLLLSSSQSSSGHPLLNTFNIRSPIASDYLPSPVTRDIFDKTSGPFSPSRSTTSATRGSQLASSLPPPPPPSPSSSSFFDDHDHSHHHTIGLQQRPSISRTKDSSPTSHHGPPPQRVRSSSGVHEQEMSIGGPTRRPPPPSFSHGGYNILHGPSPMMLAQQQTQDHHDGSTSSRGTAVAERIPTMGHPPPAMIPSFYYPYPPPFPYPYPGYGLPLPPPLPPYSMPISHTLSSERQSSFPLMRVVPPPPPPSERKDSVARQHHHHYNLPPTPPKEDPHDHRRHHHHQNDDSPTSSP